MKKRPPFYFSDQAWFFSPKFPHYKRTHRDGCAEQKSRLPQHQQCWLTTSVSESLSTKHCLTDKTQLIKNDLKDSAVSKCRWSFRPVRLLLLRLLRWAASIHKGASNQSKKHAEQGRCAVWTLLYPYFNYYFTLTPKGIRVNPNPLDYPIQIYLFIPKFLFVSLANLCRSSFDMFEFWLKHFISEAFGIFMSFSCLYCLFFSAFNKIWISNSKQRTTAVTQNRKWNKKNSS